MRNTKIARKWADSVEEPRQKQKHEQQENHMLKCAFEEVSVHAPVLFHVFRNKSDTHQKMSKSFYAFIKFSENMNNKYMSIRDELPIQI